MLNYSYRVTNSGYASLAGPVTIVDDTADSFTCPAVTTVGDGDNWLDQGEPQNSDPTAVTIEYFRSASVNEGVALLWKTVYEGNTVGFNLYRREKQGEFVQVNSVLIPSSGLEEGGVYAYLDDTAQTGK